MSVKEANRHELEMKRANDKTTLDIQKNILKAFESGAKTSKPNTPEVKDSAQTGTKIDVEDKYSYTDFLSPIDYKDLEFIQGVITEYLVAEETADIMDVEPTTASINLEDKDNYIKVLKPIDDKDVEVIQAVIMKYPVAEETAAIMSDSVNTFIKATSQADKVRYNNAVEMTGAVANKIFS